MKYTQEDISKMKYKEYIELIVKELNDNGFINPITNNPYTLDNTDMNGKWFVGSYISFLTTISDIRAIEYLKAIGLLNNGRCPLTGLMIIKDGYTYVSESNHSINFQASHEWDIAEGKKIYYGCIFGLIMFVVLMLCMFFYDFTLPLLIAAGCVLAYIIKCILKGMVFFGNNLNMQSLAKEVGITPISLKTCINFECELDKMLSHSHSSKRLSKFSSLASGDIEAYQNWKRG